MFNVEHTITYRVYKTISTSENFNKRNFKLLHIEIKKYKLGNKGFWDRSLKGRGVA